MGNAGSLTMSHLESHFGAVELAKLSRPGNFFDFTRYRPTLDLKEGRREVRIPNAVISYAKMQKGHDFLFLRLLEPHMLAEVYIASILEVFKRFGVKKYCLFGATYEMVPYTRPLLVSGTASDPMLQKKLKTANVIASHYQGPTTIALLISQQALQMGIETLSLIVHLPGYLMVENDYRGETRLLEALGSLYDFPIAQADAEKAKEQQEQVRQIAEQMIEQDPRFRLIRDQLEMHYDSRVGEKTEEMRLSPEVEKFLRDLESRFHQG